MSRRVPLEVVCGQCGEVINVLSPTVYTNIRLSNRLRNQVSWLKKMFRCPNCHVDLNRGNFDLEVMPRGEVLAEAMVS